MEDQIALLRKLSNQQDIRKKLIGGFSEEDVNAYVNNIYAHFQQIEDEYKQNTEKLESSNLELSNEFDDYKVKTAEQMVKLQDALNAGKKQASEINRLTGENKEYNTQNALLAGQLSVLEQEIEQLRAHTEELAREKNVHATQISNLEKKILSTRKSLDESLRTREELEQQLETYHATDKDIDTLMQNIIELEDALKGSQQNGHEYQNTINILTTKVEELEEQLQENRRNTEDQTIEHEIIVRDLEEKLKQKNNANPINNIHAMLDQLKDQVTFIDNQQQQLELERNRAERAEKEMSQFWGWASSLKERIHKDQLELEVQFTEIDEKYKAMHAEVNGLRTNLENFRLITGMEIDEFYNTVGNIYDISDDDGQVKQIK